MQTFQYQCFNFQKQKSPQCHRYHGTAVAPQDLNIILQGQYLETALVSKRRYSDVAVTVSVDQEDARTASAPRLRFFSSFRTAVLVVLGSWRYKWGSK